MPTPETVRCPWCGADPLYTHYHDTEWGVPERDDRALFEKLILDGFQAGLSWITILRKRDNFRKAHHAGVKMVFGTDAGVMPHAQAARQFAVMVEYGMTPIEAIQAATRNAAEALGRDKDVGAIAVGRYGDIIAVNGDPLANVRELESVDVVIKGGAVVSDRRR